MNLSADPDQEYFTDGMVEEIITTLSHFPAAVRDRAQLELHVETVCETARRMWR